MLRDFWPYSDEDMEIERSGDEDEFVPEVELFPEPAASPKIQKKL